MKNKELFIINYEPAVPRGTSLGNKGIKSWHHEHEGPLSEPCKRCHPMQRGSKIQHERWAAKRRR